MELALLVYLISLLPSIGAAAMLISFTGGIALIFLWGAVLIDEFFKSRLWLTIFTLIWVFWAFVAMLIPSEKTAYLMVGAYATQKVAEAPKTQELGAEVLKIIELKIKHYSEEAQKEMLEKVAKEKK